MKSHETMTLDECREELAGYAGFYRITKDYFAKVPPADFRGNTERYPNPVHATLDAIAAAMPEGWIVSVNQWRRPLRWTTCGTTIVNEVLSTAASEANTEILARARLCVACWRASKETP